MWVFKACGKSMFKTDRLDLDLRCYINFFKITHKDCILTIATPIWPFSVKKESVELFVYLTIGIWRGPNTNKQYPTPNSARMMRT